MDSMQVPRNDQVFLDHVGWFVPELSNASDAFQRLGFTLTPAVAQQHKNAPYEQLVPTGLVNRCAMLQSGYLELVARSETASSPLAKQHKAALDRHVGVHLIAFSVSSTENAHANLRAAGFDPLQPVRLRRPVEAEGKRGARAAFSVVRVPPGKMPEGRIQMLTHETPELVWQPHLVGGTNGISALTSALLVVEDPEEAANRFGRFLRRTPTRVASLRLIGLDRGHLIFVTPGVCRRLLPGIGLSRTPVIAAVGMAADLGVSRRLFANSGVTVMFDEGNAICIDPEAAMGTALVLHSPDTPWPHDLASHISSE